MKREDRVPRPMNLELIEEPCWRQILVVFDPILGENGSTSADWYAEREEAFECTKCGRMCARAAAHGDLWCKCHAPEALHFYYADDINAAHILCNH